MAPLRFQPLLWLVVMVNIPFTLRWQCAAAALESTGPLRLHLKVIATTFTDETSGPDPDFGWHGAY